MQLRLDWPGLTRVSGLFISSFIQLFAPVFPESNIKSIVVTTLQFLFVLILLLDIKIKFGKIRVLWNAPVKVAYVYLLYSLVSTLWINQDYNRVFSENYHFQAYMRFTMMLFYPLFLTQLFVPVLGSIRSIKNIITLQLLLGLGCFVYTLIVGVRTMGSVGFDNPNSVHPSFLAANSVLAYFCVLYIFLKNYYHRSVQYRVVLALILLSLIYTTYASISKTTLILFILLNFVFLGLLKVDIRTKLKAVGAFIMALCLALIVLFNKLAEYFSDYFNAGSNASNLSGRTTIWAVAWQHICEHPFIGNGFLFTGNYLPWLRAIYGVPHAHNIYLQILVTTGSVGLLLYTYLIYKFVKIFIIKVGKKRTSLMAILGLTLLTYHLLFGIFEASAASWYIPLPMLLVLHQAISTRKRVFNPWGKPKTAIYTLKVTGQV